MKTLLVVAGLALPLLAFAQANKADQKAKEDIAAHRAIAAAHEKAAKCLESGRSEKDCHAPLATECKGIAIGKYCGMRHRH
jgi:mannose/fructose-specific phosphotransferase system component IIA